MSDEVLGDEGTDVVERRDVLKKGAVAVGVTGVVWASPKIRHLGFGNAAGAVAAGSPGPSGGCTPGHFDVAFPVGPGDNPPADFSGLSYGDPGGSHGDLNQHNTDPNALSSWVLTATEKSGGTFSAFSTDHSGDVNISTDSTTGVGTSVVQQHYDTGGGDGVDDPTGLVPGKAHFDITCT